MLTEYTTYNSIRTVLGTTTREVSDAFLADELFENALLNELSIISATLSAETDLAAEYLDIYDDSATIDPAALAFVRAMRLFAAYFVATCCLSALPELSPVMISDSKAMLKKDKAAAAAQIVATASSYRRNLQELAAVYLDVAVPAVNIPPLLTVSTLSTDPVTGE